VQISEIEENEAGEGDLEVPKMPSRVQSANVMLATSSFEIMHIEPRRTLSADEKHTKSLILKEDDLGATPSTLSRPTTATRSIQTEYTEMSMPDPVESVIVHPPKAKLKKTKSSVSSTKDDEKQKSSTKTAKKAVKIQNSTKAAKPTVASSSKASKPQRKLYLFLSK